MWHARGGHPEANTAFALLFLRRATSGGGAVTGLRGGSARTLHLFSAGDQSDAASLGGAGQQPLSLWIKGFGVDLKVRHEVHGIRIVQVE